MSPSKIVFVSGYFNILHPGHLRLLRFARDLGGYLTVGVISDRLGGKDAYIPEHMRLDGVRCNRWVDKTLLVDEPIGDAIARLRPDYVVKGKEYEAAFNPEREVVDSYGGRLVFSSGEAVFSSVDLIYKTLGKSKSRVIDFPKEFSARHKIFPHGLVDIVQKFSGLRVCVIGDLIVDEYITCDAMGMSQEDPSIVVTPVDRQHFLGGAGIVAAHAAGLGAQVDFVSITGQDDMREYALRTLTNYGVTPYLLADDSRLTILKKRYRAQGKTLLRVSHLQQRSIDAELQGRVLHQIEEVLYNCQLLVFSDFNYGCLPEALVDKIVIRGREHELTMIADSQCSSQIGDMGRFKGMDLITPTEYEARISLRNQEDGLVILAEKMRLDLDAANIILKLGSEGALVHVDSEITEPKTDRIPALNLSPQDVAGAGDSLLITSGMALTVGANLWEAALLGSIAAAIQVGELGNIPLSSMKLSNELRFN